MSPVSKELKEKMSVAIDKLKNIFKSYDIKRSFVSRFYIYLVAYICPLETDEQIEKRKTKQKYL